MADLLLQKHTEDEIREVLEFLNSIESEEEVQLIAALKMLLLPKEEQETDEWKAAFSLHLIRGGLKRFQEVIQEQADIIESQPSYITPSKGLYRKMRAEFYLGFLWGIMGLISEHLGVPIAADGKVAEE